jgi:hypothetical protein
MATSHRRYCGGIPIQYFIRSSLDPSRLNQANFRHTYGNLQRKEHNRDAKGSNDHYAEILDEVFMSFGTSVHECIITVAKLFHAEMKEEIPFSQTDTEKILYQYLLDRKNWTGP